MIMILIFVLFLIFAPGFLLWIPAAIYAASGPLGFLLKLFAIVVGFFIVAYLALFGYAVIASIRERSMEPLNALWREVVRWAEQQARKA